ncbi:MAG TPA: vWA domain-containing protein [Mycobacteriales bacterium]|nr:vWA domain-containing protein [Mycobacteriales bacterium]
MAYTKTIDRLHPGFIMFLLDQSYSMIQDLPDRPGVSKAQGVAEAINELLFTIVRRCNKDLNRPPRHYYDIGIIGYGQEVRPMFAGSLAGRVLASVEEIANAQIRIETRDGAQLPVWFDPVTQGNTPMCSALNLAGEVANGWLQAHPHSFPPIVINITDGQSTDGDPAVWVERLRALNNADGNLLYFAINMSAAGRPVLFPAEDVELPDEHSKALFRTTSELPAVMCVRAVELGLRTAPGARGFVCNAGMRVLVDFLSVGTSVERLEAS